MKHPPSPLPPQASHYRLYALNLTYASVIHLAVSLVCHHYLPKYGHQAQLVTLASEPPLDPINSRLAFMTNFDGYHYLFNYYQQLPNFAFLPGFTLLARTLHQHLPGSLVFIWLLNAGLTYLSALSLHRICLSLSLSPAQVCTCVLLFIYSPAAVFYHSVYSEPIYCMLTFKYVEIVLSNGQKGDGQMDKLKKKVEGAGSVWKAVLWLMAAVTVRSTGMFMVAVLGVPLLLHCWHCARTHNWPGVLRSVVQGAMVLLAVTGVFACYLLWALYRVCSSQNPLPQCHTHTFMNVYSLVQEKFWNVGPFAYFRASNIVFILLGTPAIAFSALFLNMPRSEKEWGLQLSLWVLLLITITMTNLQSSTRFLSSHPAFYLNAVCFLRGARSRGGAIVWRLFRVWQLGYFYLGIVLFALEFPWT